MKKVLNSALIAVLLTFGATAFAAYWKCPDDSTRYHSKRAARRECRYPQKWAKQARVKRGLFGGGGIAGTGIGKQRADYVYAPVAEGERNDEVFVEDRGILGQGGIAGTGIGSRRGQYVDVDTSNDVEAADEE